MRRVALVNPTTLRVENCINLAESDTRTGTDTHWFIALAVGQTAETGAQFTPNDNQSPWLGGTFFGDVVSTLAVPTEVRCWQGKILLSTLGLIDAVQTYIDSPDTPPPVKLAWDNGADWHRHSPSVLAIAEHMNWDADQLDQMFYSASQIQL